MPQLSIAEPQQNLDLKLTTTPNKASNLIKLKPVLKKADNLPGYHTRNRAQNHKDYSMNDMTSLNNYDLNLTKKVKFWDVIKNLIILV